MKTIRLGVLTLCLSLGSISPGSAQLTATIIGSGSPSYDEDRANASVLISNGDTQILVDMGNGAQANLRAHGVDPSTLSALLVTHHHLDHNEEFVPLLIHSLMGRHEFEIFGPPNTAALTESNLELYAEDIDYRLGRTGRALEDRRSAFGVHDIQGGEGFEIEEIQVSTLEVPHTIYAIAYRFDFGGESVVVTGDLTYTAALPKFADGADFLIIDSGGMIMEGAPPGPRRSGRNGRTAGRAAPQRERAHLNLDESSSMASQANVGNLVYTHFVPGDVDQEESLSEIRRNYGGNVVFGEDLMVLSNAHSVTSSAESAPDTPQAALMYPIVDTGQERFYGNEGEIPRPGEDEAFYGQDAHFIGRTPSYSENGDGTITDLVTSLMWQKGSDVMSYDEALEYADDASFGGYDDWRLPSIKEMYSLIRFDGVDPSGRDMSTVPEGAKPFIDTDYFEFEYGANGERVIDSQYLTTTIYTGRTMGRDRTVFGVNMADGRIKGYPMADPRSRAAKDFSVKLVRGNPLYGQNQFVDNADGTVSDAATGLMWTKEDTGQALTWEGALAWVQQMNAEGHLGYSDWKLPDAKELQSILDYSRSPQATNSAAIDPVFSISTIKDESGEDGYPFFWSSTTHRSTTHRSTTHRNANGRGSSGVYLCFGEALGYMRFPGSGEAALLDVHGAGAQRSDPKVGDAGDYPQGHGPQGDVVRISHYVRLVRGIQRTQTSNSGLSS